MSPRTWDNENRLNTVVKYIGFLINPIIGVLLSLYHINTKSSFVILFLAFITFGFSMVVPEERTEDFGFDSVVYRSNFENAAGDSSSDIQDNIISFFAFSGDTDIYGYLMMYLISRFTGNYHIFFMIVAAIMAIFMLKTLRYLVTEDGYRFSIYGLCLLFLFTMSQILGVNAFRFYTAYWMALFALFKICVDKQNRYFILLALTPLIHASYFVLLFIVPFYYLLRHHHTAAIILLALSLMFSALSLTILSKIIELLPASLSSHYDAYIDSDYIYRINKSGTGYIWVRRILETLVLLSINVVALIFAKNRKTNIETGSTACQNIYALLLAFTIFVNFSIGIPSVGSRYIMFTYPLIAYVSLRCFPAMQYRKIISLFALFYISMFLILPWNIYQIPCLNFYRQLTDTGFWLYSPVVSFVKYVIMP